MTIGQRLRRAMVRAGLTQKEVARRTGLETATVSDVVNDRTRPGFDTVERMVRAIGTTFGELFDEARIHLSGEDVALGRSFQAFLDRLLENDSAQKAVTETVPPRMTPPALRTTSMIRDDEQPPLIQNHDIEDLPAEQIPERYYRMGARRAFKVLSDAMIGSAILKGTLIYVRPTIDVASADGEIIVCRLNRTWYLKRLDLRGRRKTLESTNPRYPTLVVSADDDFTMFGVVTLLPAPQ